MPEGHTLHRLAGTLQRAFGGDAVAASSPQGRFASGAALLDGATLERANAWLQESVLVRELVGGLDPLTRSRALADRAYWNVRHSAAAARRARRTRGQGVG